MSTAVPDRRSFIHSDDLDRSAWIRSAIGYAVAYTVAALVTLRPEWFGLAEVRLDNVVWLGSGITLAAVLRLGPGFIPMVFVVEMTTTLVVGDALGHAVGSGMGNALECAIALILLRSTRASIRMGRARDVVALVGLAAGLSALLGAGISTWSLITFEGIDSEGFTRIWLLWWLTHANGMLLVTPLLMSINAGELQLARRRPFEAMAIATLVLLLGVLLFGAEPSAIGARRLLYVPFPFLLWAAFRFRLVGASSANLLLSLPAIVGTALGRGPFAAATPNDALVPLWVFMAVNAITALLVAGVVEEREREVEARLQAEEERRRLSERMQRGQRAESLGMLAGGIAHDFNNLLVTILGNAEIAERRLGEDHPAGKSIAEITRASQRASELCRQMLAFAGRGRVSNGVIDIAEVAVEMTELLSVSFSDETVLEVDVDPETPNVWGDVTQIRRVVLNLLTNANDALRDGRGRIRVSTGRIDPSEIRGMDLVTDARPKAAAIVHITVEDDGIGMTDEVRERIFDPFYTTKAMGRGLGLAAVIGIVRAHGGALEVRSAPEKGARFRVLLPGSSVRARPTPEIREPVADRRGEILGTVLLVEDEASVREVVTEMLAELGMDVLQAGDGVEAVEIFTEKRASIDVVLMDLTMPRMNGYEALGRMREIDPGVNVVLTTGNADEPEAVAEKWGVRVLPKPYRSSELSSEIRKALERRVART